MSRKFVCSETEPIVTTPKGKIRGFIQDGIYTFHGIKYANAQRWHMPEEVEAWDGVKDALNYGFTCPTNGNPAPTSEIYITHRFWPENEHCQYLNIWTKSIDSSAKKPVVVWLHGGGYANGSSIEQAAYEGDQLAEHGDVVVVTLNHRLNILGCLDLTSFGEEYHNSPNLTIADLVVALKWVHDNISAFGGDPDNVTIFGQSGGGGKVCCLLQTPAAEGLFHKALMMSGGAGTMSREEYDHRPVVLEMMKMLHIEDEDIKKLEKVPYTQLIWAYNHAAYKLNTPLNWAPKANDWYIGHPIDVGFSNYAKKVPLIVSSVYGEMTMNNKLLEDGVEPTEENKMAALKKLYGDHTDEVIASFHEAYPNKDISQIVKVDRMARPGIIKFMNKHADECSAPGYSFNLAVDFPLFGISQAWHCADIPYIFHNIDRVPCYGFGEVSDRLQDEMSGALVSFAYTGDPNHEGMAQWRPYTKDDKATMVFDAKSECKAAYDEKLLDNIEKYGPEFKRPNFSSLVIDENDTRAWMY